MVPTWWFLILVWAWCLPLMPAAEEQGEACKPERCGNLTVYAPFGVVTGSEVNQCAQLGFQVHCAGDIPYLGNFEPAYGLRILDIFYSNASLLVSDIHKLAHFSNSSNTCSNPTASTASKVAAPFSISSSNWNLVFYNCSREPAERGGLVETACRNNTFVRVAGRYNKSSGVEGAYVLEGCNATAAVPVLAASTGMVDASDYMKLISDGFLLTWQTPPAAASASSSGSKRTGRKILLIVLTSAAAALLFPCIYVLIRHRMGKRHWFLLWKKTSSNTERNYEAMIASYGSLAPKRYMYSEVMKITSSRSDHLGRGGYGVVFKGILHDGHLVAVKFLHDCKGDEFVNEVISIGRTSHVNVVSLHGFCLEGSKRALIYEYMSNGSLDKYIYSENPKEILGWERLHVIAIGIARGLEYLHHSCNVRIVHLISSLKTSS